MRLRESSAIFSELAEVQGTEFQVQARLRERYADDVVRAALTLAELRRKAVGKFAAADQLWFDRQGLEQATAETIATYKAQRFDGPTWDWCCGMGSDAAALSKRVAVTAVDARPVCCLETAWNASVLGQPEQLTVLCGDVTGIDPARQLVHVDPDRRPGGGNRVQRLEDYAPNLAFLQALTSTARGGAIKLSPASNFGGKFPHAEVELISLQGECKEATIWFGELANSATYRATVLPAGVSIAGHPLDALAERSTLGCWIYDPDPAVVRAGLVDLLAETLGLRRLDDAEEYLTSDSPVWSPFVQTFEVLKALPNQDREIRHALRASDFGPLEIKCRHIPIQADALRKKLPRGGDQPGVLIFAREQGKAKAILARRSVEQPKP
ncbi:hypothetical protein GC163_01635 [bacterium]|nr:hypothetical protein [bacterium]